MMPNPHFNEIFIGTQIAFACLKFPLQALFLRVYNKTLPVAKFPLGTESRRNKAEICAERVFRLLVYISCSTAGYLLMKDTKYLNKYLLGNNENPQYYGNFPCDETPPLLDSFYVVVLAYHFFETMYTLLCHRHRHDFSENMLHHIVTIVLTGFSYYLNMLTLGTITMFVTDMTDIFVALFKLTVDIHNSLQYWTYGMMLVTWFYFRVFYFPIFILKEHWQQGMASGHPV
jgi:TLC domain